MCSLTAFVVSVFGTYSIPPALQDVASATARYWLKVGIWGGGAEDTCHMFLGF